MIHHQSAPALLPSSFLAHNHHSSPLLFCFSASQLSHWFGPRRCLPQHTTVCLPTLLRLPLTSTHLSLTSPPGPSTSFHATWPLMLQRLVSHHGLSLQHVALRGPTPPAAVSGDADAPHAAAAAALSSSEPTHNTEDQDKYQWVLEAVVRGEGLCPGRLRRAVTQTLADLASERARAPSSSPILGDTAAPSLPPLHVRTSATFGDARQGSDSNNLNKLNLETALLPERSEVQRAMAARGPAPVGKAVTDPEVPQVRGPLSPCSNPWLHAD